MAVEGTLAALALVLAVAHLLGEAARRSGSVPVVGELLTGLVLGPSLLGGAVVLVRADDPALATASALGLVFVLVLAGFELDAALLRRRARATLLVSAGGLVVPFALGAALGWWLPASVAGDVDRLLLALFFGTALSVSAIPVIARILVDLDAIGTELGQVTVAAAMVTDTVGWLLLSGVAALAAARTTGNGPTLLPVAFALLAVLAFAALPGRPATSWVLGRFPTARGTLGVVVALALGAAAATAALGLEAVLGAFLVGALVRASGQLEPGTREAFETITIAVFAPFFFAAAGLRADLTLLFDPLVALVGGVTLLAAVGGKVVGVVAGAALAGYDRRTALALAVGLNARGAVEIVLASVGLALGVLTPATYTVVVLVAVATSVMAAPLLRRVLASAPGRPATG